MDFGESFKVFTEKFEITEELASLILDKPDQSESHQNGVTFYFKQISNTRKKNLLLATQEVKGKTIFSFAYWIPEEIIPEFKIQLIEVLEIFVNKFGLKLKTNLSEAQFIKNQKVALNGKLNSPFQIITILGDSNIPCNLMLSFMENPVGNINWVLINYAFAINNNRYLTWLKEVETTEISIPSDWYKTFNQIVDSLDPFGETKLLFRSPHSTDKESEDNIKYCSVTIPKPPEKPLTYQKPLDFFSKSVRSLKPGEKAWIIPVPKNERCIFCDSDELSSEHIFPKWSRKYFSKKTFYSTLMTQSPEENLLESLKSSVTGKKESSYGYVVGNVCEACNNNWMSQLEDYIKKILTNSDGLKSNIKFGQLEDECRFELARWAVIKSLLLAVKLRMPTKFPTNVFQDLKSGTIPKGFAVEVFEQDYYDLDFGIRKGLAHDNQIRLKKYSYEIAKEESYGMFCGIIHFGYYIFRISYFKPHKFLRVQTFMRKMDRLFGASEHFELENDDDLWQNVQPELRSKVLTTSLLITDHLKSAPRWCKFVTCTPPLVQVCNLYLHTICHHGIWNPNSRTTLKLRSGHLSYH